MREKLYRNITKPSRLFGLELANLGIFVVLAPLLFRFIGNPVTGAGLALGLYLILRRYEKGKPQGYTLTLISYFLSSERYTVELERSK